AYTAAQAHVALSREYGDSIPDPRAPDAIPAERGVREKARLLIPVEIAEEPVRVNISLPGAALEALDRTAKELSLSRSGAIAYLALEREARADVSVPKDRSKQQKKRAKA